ncbi:GNAT family N-acetyltransferase [Promicromonospora thailandica]|uniref:Acetyltransferase (GNAT) domain-containing protein n=1 Tax=Promicromonospora thailandica TaxID=765201 RepID=A0A9X2JTY6_9MICO|nr:GNAT family N-acetyltransferase [Promicromonospora thailandica]MCP2263446.1 Acetyltransferase (GNAT) domain-containing protein [Promicromonospora thailandica]BFF19387.1 GNAT family N-acetyltransferase [Promicromonospora thailandica]
MTIEVRDAHAGEYVAIGEIVTAAFAADGQLGTDGSTPYAAVLRDVAGRAAHAQIIAALDGGVVVGGVTFVPHGGPMADLAREGEAEIRMLGVAPDAQGRGAGTALVRECLARATVPRPVGAGAGTPPGERGTRRVVLSTNTIAHGSHRLYERLGFVREPARDWTPVPGVDLLCYVLEL